MTNSTKALIITAINSFIGLVAAFGVAITAAQTGAILLFANSIGAIIVALTYKRSSKRIPDGKVAIVPDPAGPA